jgi:hypothetical protein
VGRLGLAAAQTHLVRGGPAGFGGGANPPLLKNDHPPRPPPPQQAGGAGGRTTYDALLAADAAWRAIRATRPGDAGPAPTFVTTPPAPIAPAAADDAFDVVCCGGTLGVFVAAALAQRGHRVAVVERGPLAGRAQEWNISRKELEELVEMGLMGAEEAEAAVAIEFNPVGGWGAGRRAVDS